MRAPEALITSALASTAITSLCNVVTAASGVPVGAIRPYHDSTTKPATAAWLMVGEVHPKVRTDLMAWT